jgi:hypothetical protein
MSKLKGVIFSVEDTLVPQGSIEEKMFADVTKLVSYLLSINIKVSVFTNRLWTVGENKTPLEEALKLRWGDTFTYYCGQDDEEIPKKPSAVATEYVLEKMNLDSSEVIYIGSSENDMRTAVNGKLLFLRATWWANKTNYGFEFDSPKSIARYIDTFCLREHLWCHEIQTKDFRFYALAPFSTMKPEYTLYSEDARKAAKHGLGHPDFWTSALFSSLYFSGIHKEIDYITTYPGHEKGSGNVIMEEAGSVFAKCFRKTYIPDLIIRHKKALKSQTARNNGVAIDHLNQLNTIKLNENPTKNAKNKFKTSPLKKGKTVLLIDDICTRGYSLESARAYIEKTGAKVIMASWLKTINTDIETLGTQDTFNPYSENTFESPSIGVVHGYHANFTDHLAPAELTKQFKAYENWDWPE